MPIFEKTRESESVTEGWRTLELFTDRYSYISLFLSYLNDYPQRESILYFFGEGGNGKSLLLKYLHENYCKVITSDNWNWIKERTKSDAALVRLVRTAQGTEPAIAVMLDFGLSP